MARITKPTKPAVTDSIEKWNAYREKKQAWDNAVERSKREKEAKKLMSKGEFAQADKLLKGKGSMSKPRNRR